jgi:hypothetical protein
MAKADALAMLAIARRDLQAAQGMTNTSTFHEAVWGVHVQQTVEKALKAWRRESRCSEAHAHHRGSARQFTPPGFPQAARSQKSEAEPCSSDQRTAQLTTSR